jgi:hypothetical protein
MVGPDLAAGTSRYDPNVLDDDDEWEQQNSITTQI